MPSTSSMSALASVLLLPALLLTPQDQDPIGPVVAPPPAPVFQVVRAGTQNPEITVSGAAPRAVEVRLTTPLEPELLVPVVDGGFTTDIQLELNSVNVLSAVSVDQYGVVSAPATAAVIQDETPPEVFVDFPVDGAVIETVGGAPTTDVAGRVGDPLSGFQGLMVRVNGQTADVNVGIGTNGTFFFPDLPLNADGDTTIEVTASDGLLNVALETITVTHETIVEAPAITMLSGNGQSGQVRDELPQPLRVLVQKADGSAFAGKVVTLQATQSDGRLSPTQGGAGELVAQVFTDANGEAEVWWTLGSDSGSGNNRVRATSAGAKGTVEFCASAAARPPAQIAIGSGDDQWGEAGAPAVHPLVVFVHDGQNAVAGEPVIFSVVKGGGLVDGKNVAVVDTDVTGHAKAAFTFGPAAGRTVVEATFAGNPGLPARFALEGIARDAEAPTRFRGIVLDNALQPLQGAQVALEVAGESFPGETGVDGAFEVTGITRTGTGHLKVDGTTVFHRGGTGDSSEDVPPGTYPALEYEVVVVQGAANELPLPVLLPALRPENEQIYDGSELVLSLNTEDPDTGQVVPLVDGLEFRVKAGTVVTWQGQQWGAGNPLPLSVNLVHADKIPMPMPDGAGPPFAWTLQPGGAHFDPPIEVTLPNTAGLPAGAVGYMLSFDHDIGQFLIVSSAKVTADGAFLVSDPGDGIDKAGWGGFCPPYPDPGEVTRKSTRGPCEFSDYERPTRHSPIAAPTPEVRSDDWVAMAGSMARQEVQQDVYGHNGEYWHQAIDMRIRGRGFDFVWGRKYRTILGPPGLANDPAGGSPLGNKWQCSYDVRLVDDPDGLKLFDGTSREDLYFPVDPDAPDDGPWCKRGFHREVVKNPDASYTLYFSDRSTWTFHPLGGGAPDRGKLWKSADRNGNTMTFVYDNANDGRLDHIVDTTGRQIDLSYVASGPLVGHIQSISDFAGRTVTYEYYPAGDPDGNLGDLKSVTTPATADFPAGKTTTYEYLKASPNPDYESFLKSITDPKGQEYLAVEYYGGVPDDFDYRHVKRVRLGDAADWIDYAYTDLHPEDTQDPVVDEPTKKTTVTDRNGNVVDTFYDDCNREHKKVVRATPTDHVWQYEWNDDYLLKKTIEPDGSVVETVYESDVRPTCPVRNRANVVTRIERVGTHPEGADQPLLRWVYEYDTTAAKPGDPSDGFNFVTREIDPRNKVSVHEYDAVGNRIETRHPEPGVVENWTYYPDGQVETRTLPSNGAIRRVDSYTYDTNGYLASETLDANGFALTTTFGRNAVGILTSLTDPKGSTTLLEVNARDQLVEATEDAGGFGYVTSFTYDANDNIVRVDRPNVDHTGAPIGGDPILSTTTVYDVLNHPLQETREVGIGADVVTEYEYDRNRNRTLVRAHAGRPGNYVRYEYEERNLVRLEDRSGVLVTTYEYDGKGNSTRVVRGGDQATESRYDAYDRPLWAQDPIGNVATMTYDANGNVLSTVVEGPGGDPTGRLSEVTYTYDDLNRRTVEDVAYFDYATGAPLDGGHAVTTTTYAPNSQVLAVENPNGHVTATAYDTMNRIQQVVDAAGNRVEHEYDDNSNLVTRTELELHADGSGESYVTTYLYDALDRAVLETNPVGESVETKYDSRDKATYVLDANGYEVLSVYDGLDRLVSTTREVDGVTSITTTQDWDENSRLLGQTDGNGNTTSYEYDDLDRRTRTSFADGTVSEVLLYDVHGNALQVQDPNGTLVESVYDDGNRVVSRAITPGPGVSGDLTTESFTYDGLSNVLTAADDDSAVTRTYSSFGTVETETLAIGPLALPGGGVSYTPRTVTSDYDRAGNLVRCVYPGGRTIESDFDELERKERVRDVTGGGDVVYAEYAFFGPRRVERCALLNGTTKYMSYDGVSNPAGDFGDRRPIETLHEFDPTPESPGSGDEVTVDHRTYAWDRMQNKTRRADVRPGGPEFVHTYAYDRSYRLVRTTVEDTAQTVLRDQDYQLDRVGNREQVSGPGVLEPGPYVLDPTLPVPGDYQVNQYTSTPADGDRLYDENGNLLVRDDGGAGQADMAYDYLNHMVSYDDVAAGQLSRYFYDASGRRIARVVDAAGTPGVTLYYYAPGGRVCEERDAGEAVQATYLYGHYVDEVLSMSRGGEDYFYHGDDLHNVMALTDAAGAVVERYEYGDYGRVLDPSTLVPVVSPSTVVSPFFFAGRRYDLESGYYFLRARYVDPAAGRFTTRDPLGTWGDTLALGNSYTFAANNPWTFVDPTGAKPIGSVGELIYEKAPQWGVAGAFLYSAWSVFGAESTSRVVHGKNTSGWDYAGATLEALPAAGFLAKLGAWSAGRAARAIPDKTILKKVPHTASMLLEEGLKGAFYPSLNKIIVDLRLPMGEFVTTLKHEAVHKALNNLTRGLSSKLYARSPAWKHMEEVIAETFATGSLSQGRLHALNDYTTGAQRALATGLFYASKNLQNALSNVSLVGSNQINRKEVSWSGLNSDGWEIVSVSTRPLTDEENARQGVMDTVPALNWLFDQ